MSRVSAEDRLFAQRIKEERTKAGMSQETLAKRGGFSNQQTVCKIESGQQPVTLGQAVRLASVLGYSLAGLIDGGQQPACVRCDDTRQALLALARA